MNWTYKSKLFDSIVLPVLLYGAEVWGAYGTKIVSRTPLKYYKQVLHLNKSTCTVMVLGETGRLPVEEIVKMRILNYWFRMVTCENEYKLTSRLYALLLKLYSHEGNHFKSPWLDYVKTCLDDLGMSYIWLNQKNLHFVNKMWFKNAIKIRITDQYKCKWSSIVLNSDSCTFYRMIKAEFTLEKYLKVLPTNLAIRLAKFRCRNHKLPVVIASYDRAVVDDRCPLCDKRALGDEFHMIFECTYLENEREELLGRKVFRNVNTLFVNRFFNSGSQERLSKICRFIKIGLSLFR